jgi:hypothetical protein
MLHMHELYLEHLLTQALCIFRSQIKKTWQVRAQLNDFFSIRQKKQEKSWTK